MKKDKSTKKLGKRLDRHEKAARKQEREFQMRKKASLDTLQTVRQLVAANIVIDLKAIDQMISEVEAGTTPSPVREITS